MGNEMRELNAAGLKIDVDIWKRVVVLHLGAKVFDTMSFEEWNSEFNVDLDRWFSQKKGGAK